jgi:hypothetical protein
MSPGRPPRSSRLRRLVRGWRLDRNPLRRRSDRVETAIIGLLFAFFLVGAPLAWHFAGSWAYPVYAREAKAERALIHQVPATLLKTAPGWSASGPGAEVNVQWKAPGGQLRTAPVFIPDGAVAGATVMVWIDQAGQLTDPPLEQAQVASRAQLARVLADIALAVTVLVTGALTHKLLVRRRLAAWEADWLAKGPDWSPRR